MTYLIIIAIAIIIIVIGEAAYLIYSIYRKRKAQRSKVLAEETEETAEPVTESTETIPELEQVAPPVIAEPSALPEEAKSTLMNAVWYRCENPRCNYTQFLDVHHIVPEAEGGSNTLDNLIVLCPNCRAAVDTHEISEEELRSWVKERVERFKFALDWPYK